MTRAALTKLFILVILAFIICLPEFFSLYKVLKVTFLCVPYRPCERGNQVTKGELGRTEDAEIKRRDMCDPYQAQEREQWELACTHDNRSYTTDPVSDSRRDGEENSWFICQTDTGVTKLHSNISSSDPNVHVEVTVELQLGNTETLNLTLYDHSKTTSLHFYPPEEEEEEELKKGQDEAFYCCLPILTESESDSQSRCLLRFANITVLTATVKEKLPWKQKHKDEWWCIFRVMWLALVCLVLLTIVTSVFGQIYRRKCSYKKPTVHPVGYIYTDGEKNTGVTPKVLHTYGPRTWTGLSPIEERDIQEDIETLLHGNVDNCYNAIHPSSSSQRNKPGDRGCKDR
ncbi:uncharacterized protein LOC113128644 isoform X2 [Mastacembelus armatus]|uniref:uncharacterized protein LOC113128644 isoform X2 n=1 Tax=Mastacembelus armatus TaxID=205130 RepID=UPI000E4569D8|nr:uncharacterized protein LOC113128644 isoform X2 [Mastacembelus armatus]